LAKSAEAEKNWSPEEKAIVEKLYNEMQSVYLNSAKFYKTYRQNREKKGGEREEFATLSISQYHKGDRLSPEADEFDQKIKEVGGSKKVDISKKTIVWRIPKK